ncbi:MAG: hypothetical protein FVQ85_16480 [Planctomycetes bacterium]|nr:hypothetical protein [Planctomycetota bacterium]
MKNKSSAKRSHEKQVCKVVASFIAKIKNLTIDDIISPEEEEHNEQAVDALIKCSSIEIVLEHTRIESYPEQIADNYMVKNLLKPLVGKLTGKLPTPGHYRLSIDVGAVKGAKDTERVQKALIAWVQEKAPLLELPVHKPSDKHYIREKPCGVPFEVALHRLERRDGKFTIELVAPAELETKRRRRIKIALEKKCPKLSKAKGETRISVLLLELDDICLGDPIQTAKAVTEELSQNDVPDEIYLVETEAKPWVVWVLKDGEALFSDLEDWGPYDLDPLQNNP